jgi:hypothetical protein
MRTKDCILPREFKPEWLGKWAMPARERLLSARVIEAVPALLVSLLHHAGKLPTPPDLPDPQAFGFRAPGIEEMRAFEWVAQWEGAKLDEMGFRAVSGLIAYRDTYDFHSASDVCEVVYLAGSPRSSIELLRWARTHAHLDGRRVLGAFSLGNTRLRRAAAKLGASETRIMVEG